MESGLRGLAGKALSDAALVSFGPLSQRPPATFLNTNSIYYSFPPDSMAYVSTGSAWLPLLYDAGIIGSGIFPPTRLGTGLPSSDSVLHGDGQWKQGVSGAPIGPAGGVLSGTYPNPGVAAQTGTGSVFVMQASPTLTTPLLGTPTSGTLTNCDGTAAALTAGKATVLATARTINGTSFDGSANITITAAAGTLTGTTLNSTVVTSSLTALGTITTGVWTGTTIAIANGGTGVTSVTISPTASAWAGWDANKNLSANSFLEGYRTTATAGATTTLVVGDAEQQYFTGTLTQTCKLPVTSTLVLGQSYRIVNLSTGAVTVQSSGANTVQAMATNTVARVTCILTSGTDALSWNVEYYLPSGGATYTADESTLTLTGTVFSEKANGTTNAKLAQMSTQTLKGNNTGVLGNAADLSVTTVRTMLSVNCVNHLINGGFDYMQRGDPVNGTSPSYTGPNAADVYTADRWKGNSDVADAGWKLSRVAGGPNSANYLKCLRAAANTTPGKILLGQIIESNIATQLSNSLSTVTFQAQVRMPTGGVKVNIGILQWTGTADAPTKFTAAGAWTADTTDPTFATSYLMQGKVTSATVGNTWILISTNFTLGSGITNLVPVIWLDKQVSVANSELDIAEADLFVSSASGLQTRSWRSRPTQQELAMCQRYFCKTMPIDTEPVLGAAFAGCLTSQQNVTLPSFGWRFPVSMRISPTATALRPGGGAGTFWRDAGDTQTGVQTPRFVFTSADGTYVDSSGAAEANTTWCIHVKADADL